MAQRLEAFNFTDRRSQFFTTKYPWPTWTDGQIWQLKQGEDFDCSAVSFRTLLSTRAIKMKCKVRVNIQGDQVTFQFYQEA